MCFHLNELKTPPGIASPDAILYIFEFTSTTLRPHLSANAVITTFAGNIRLCLMTGDITQQETDAIVNAANSSLMGGGGVDGAIHRAGGPTILEECRKIRTLQGPCPTGHAVITSGGCLKARHVIHTVGPVWKGGHEKEEQILSLAYENSLCLAARHDIKTIAFPSISTGAYGFPIDHASRIAFTTVRRVVGMHPVFSEVRFVVFSPSDYDVYAALFTPER